MQRIDEVERRLEAAFARIGAALAAVPSQDRLLQERDTARAEAERLRAEVAELRQRLDEEIVATGQLKARNEALHARITTLEAEAAERMPLGSADDQRRERLLGQLRRVNGQLRENNQALRQAILDAAPDARLVNRAMLAELESIRVSRDTDRAELDRVLAGLGALLGGREAAEEAGDA